MGNQGAYVLLGGEQHGESRPHRHHSPFARPLRSRATHFRLAIYIWIVAAVTIALVYLRSASETETISDELAAVHRAHLAAPLNAEKIIVSETTTKYVVGEHHSVTARLTEEYEWIDSSTRQPFEEVVHTNGMNNNAMARMPAGSPYDMMVVARGKNNRYFDEIEGIEYVNLTIVGFFVNYDPSSGGWVRAGPAPYVLDLPVWRQYPRPCENLVNGGGADPRLIWSDAGEPLAIIGTSSRVPGICKAIAMVDLRAVWPGLKDHLEVIGYGDIPILFDRFTEVGKVGDRAPYEKNWAACFSGPKPAIGDDIVTTRGWGRFQSQRGPSVWPYFATQIENRTVVQVNEALLAQGRSTDSYVLAESLDLTTTNENGAMFEANSKCIFDSLPSGWNSTRVHLATPFYRVTLCPRGNCTPSRENTVLLGLIHYKQERRSYRRMFVTMKVDAPFEIISVSPPLHFGSAEMDEGVVFSVSLAFLPTKKSIRVGEKPFEESQDGAGGWLAHGWLDDTLVVGTGLRDAAYDAVHLPTAMALRGHTLC